MNSFVWHDGHSRDKKVRVGRVGRIRITYVVIRIIHVLIGIAYVVVRRQHVGCFLSSLGNIRKVAPQAMWRNGERTNKV